MRLTHSQKFAMTALLAMSIVGCSSSDDNGGGLLADADAAVDPATLEEVEIPDLVSVEGLNSSNFAAFGMRTIESINLTQLTAERLRAEDLVNDIFLSGLSVLDGGESLTGLTLGAQTNTQINNVSFDIFQAFICDDGGSLQLSYLRLTGAPFSAPSVTFNSCTLEGDTFNGTVEISSGRQIDTIENFTSYSRTSAVEPEEGSEELPTQQSVELNGEFINAFSFFSNTENQTWTNTTFAISGTENDETLTITDWERRGTNTHFPGNDQGFIPLLDGTTGRAQLFTHGASLTANMEVSNAESSFEPISVVVALSFSNDYFDWFDDAFSVFSVPFFPVSDLGSPLDLFSTPDFATATVQSVDSQPLATAPQWSTGEILLVTQNASALRIQPDPEMSDSILIELNGSGEQQSALWADGYQAFCPSVIDGCSQP